MFAARGGFQTQSAVEITYPSEGVLFEISDNNRVRYSANTFDSQPADSWGITVAAWIKLASLPATGKTMNIFDIRNGTYTGAEFELRPSNQIQLYQHWGSGFIQQYATYTPGFATDEWIHVIWTTDLQASGKNQIWVNGVKYVDFTNTTQRTQLDWNSTATYYGYGARSQPTLYTNHLLDGCLEQLYVKCDTYDVASNISKFYDNGYVDFGANGNSSGLPLPDIYHQGNTQAEFIVNGGASFENGTSTVSGTLGACS